MKGFSSAEKRILLVLTLAYTGAYLCRTNLSMTLSGIVSAFSLTQAQGGLMATVFSVIYALGQTVVGARADRVDPRSFIVTGLIIASISNFAAGFAGSFLALVCFWCVNAAGQAMLWTPIVRVISITFEPGERRTRASFIMSITIVAGYVISWAISGLVVAKFDWRGAFITPSAITLLIALATFWFLRDVRAEKAPKPATASGRGGALGVLGATGLIFVLLGAVANGFMRDSIMTWGPTILMDTQDAALERVLGMSLLIPVINFLGILLSRRLFRLFGNSARKCSGYMLIMGSVTSLALAIFYKSGIYVAGALIALTAATAYGINPPLTSLLPLEYDNLGRVGLVAGLVDSFIYLGSGISGVAVGALADSIGWRAVFICWCIAGIAGAAFMLLSNRKRYLEKL